MIGGGMRPLSQRPADSCRRRELLHKFAVAQTTLTKTGRRTDGAREFQELMKRFPNNALAAQACTQLGNLGLRCPAAGHSGSAATKGTAKRSSKK